MNPGSLSADLICRECYDGFLLIVHPSISSTLLLFPPRNLIRVDHFMLRHFELHLIMALVIPKAASVDAEHLKIDC
jgi:hypothetical protein